jgi:hypothetical protein
MKCNINSMEGITQVTNAQHPMTTIKKCLLTSKSSLVNFIRKFTKEKLTQSSQTIKI